MRAEPRASWTPGQRRLHWLTACLVVAAFALAWLMVGVPLRQLLLKFLLYQLHKSLGIMVFGIVAVRLALRGAIGRPHWDAGLSPARQRLAAHVHGLLYAALLLVPLLGYLTAATAPAQVPTLFLGLLPIPHLVGPDPAWFALLRPLHRWLAILLVTLAGGHAVVALLDHRHGGESLLRMWRGEVRPAAPQDGGAGDPG